MVTLEIIVFGSLDKHAPLISKRIRNKHNIPWINKNTKNLIFERNRIKRKAIISKSDADWSTFKSLRNRVNSTLRNDKEIFYRTLINKKQDRKDAWKAINGILGRKQPKPIINNLKLENEDIVVGPKEVSDCFNNHFTRVGTKIANSVESGRSSFTEYLTDVSSDIVPLISTVLFLTCYIRSPLLKQLHGIDQISGKILILAAPAIIHNP